MSLAFFILLQTIVWFLTAQEARYLIHGYVVAAIFAVWGWRHVAQGTSKPGSLLAGLAIALSVVYGAYMIGAARAEDLHAAISSSFAEKRRSQEVPFVDTFKFLSYDTSVQTVLILDPRVPPFYLEKTYIKLIGRHGEQTISEANDLQRVLSQLHSWRISHVLDVRTSGEFRLPEQPKDLTLIFERQNQRIYRVD
jgi:hypothetical protein